MIRLFRTAGAFSLAITGLLVFGCGGGGGGTSSSQTSAGGGGTTSLMTPAARAAILANANTVMESLVSATGTCDSNQLLTAVQKISGLTGLSVAADGNVVGTFSDGVPFTFVNNRPIDQTITSSVSASNQARVSSSSPVELLDSEDPIFVPSHKYDDAAAFNAHGYPGTSLTLSTVDALKALGGHTIGCLGIAGHGGLVKDPYAGAILGFGVWTATSANFDPSVANYNGLAYQSDLLDHSVGIMCAVTRVVLYKGKTYNVTANHYCIMSHFPVKYGWKFSNNSYVSLGICYGASGAASLFRQNLYSLGATVVSGWTNTVLSTSDYYNNSYMYDRLLGANTINGATPPRRPFPWPQALAALNVQGMVTVTYSGKTTVWQFMPNSSLAGKPIFTILNPSIQSDYIQPTTTAGASDTLHVEAYLGVPGAGDPTVTVGSASNPLTTSTPFTVNSALDYTAPLSNSANGTVLAKVPGIGGTALESYPRNISAWSGNVTCIVKGIGSTSGQTVRTGVFDLHFRNDLQSSYLAPDDKAPTAIAASVVEGNSLYPATEEKLLDSLQVTGSGTSVSTTMNGSNFHTVTDVFTGSSAVSLLGTSGLFNGVLLSVPPAAGQAGYLEAYLDTENFLTDIETITQTGSPPTTNTYMANMAFSSQYFLGDNGTNEYVPINTDGNFNVSAKTFTNGSGAPGTGIQEILECSSMPCTSPPINNTAR